MVCQEVSAGTIWREDFCAIEGRPEELLVRMHRRGKDKEEINMAKIYYQEDCNLSLLDDKTIAVIGYGSQGHAHALNAKESGCHVIIGLYEGSKSWAKAEAQGFEVYTAAEAEIGRAHV